MYRYTDTLWERLEKSKKPVVLYGTGNGADKIFDELERRCVKVDAVFASSGFVRDRYYKGLKVESFESVTERLGCDIDILLCFGTNRPDVMEQIRRVGEKCNLCIPDVPLYGGELFDVSYLNKHKKELTTVRDLLDDKSKLIYDDCIAFRITGKAEYLGRTEPMKEAYLRLAKAKKIEYAVDVGAYNGDTAEIFSNLPDIKSITAIEPDPKTFRKLKTKAESITHEKGLDVTPLRFAASDTETVSEFSVSGSRGSGAGGKNKRAETEEIIKLSIDAVRSDILNGLNVFSDNIDSNCLKNCDLMKFDVEGDEAAALKGAENTIRETKTALSVSLYHRTDDLWYLPLRLKEKFPHLNHFSLTRPDCIPFWDLTLVAYGD